MPKKKSSSPKKPAKKAATRPPSTTSSTTAPASGRRKPAGNGNEEETLEPLDLADEPHPLTRSQQSAVLDLLSRGASPAGACGQVGVSIDAFLQTVSDDPEFRAKVRGITNLLSGNVMAVLYRTAMEGNVSAQQAWLKLFPPPTFAEPETDPEPMTFDDLLGDLTDAELVELARAVGVDLPHEVEANLDAQSLSYLAEQISGWFAIDARG